MAKKNFSREELQKYFTDPKYRKNNSKGFISRHKKFFIFSGVVILILFIALSVYVFMGLPSFEELENPRPSLASNVYSYDGQLLGQFFIQNRIETHIDSLPKHLVNALIATEDRKFYSHWGVDLDRFVKAIVKNIITLSKKSGGASTITQQLARNLYQLVEREENLLDIALRKVREWITAVQIEKTYTKDEILVMYFNIAYFGRGSYGIESAARNFFGKPASKLNLQESALLVAMLRNPWYYDPIRNPENSYSRRNLILRIMNEQGFTTEDKYQAAISDNIRLMKTSEFTKSAAPHFLEYVRQQLIQKAEKYEVDIYRDGLNIFTTIDFNMQKHANEAVAEHLKEYQPLFDKSWTWNNKSDLIKSILEKGIKNHPSYLSASNENEKQNIASRLRTDQRFIDSLKKVAQTIEAGFIAIEPRTGHIRAMVGGANHDFMYGLNHTTQIKRQPGSAFKPIIYTVAIDNGYPLATEVLNEPITLEIGNQTYSPRNSNDEYGGYLSFRKGLAGSVNMISVRLISEGMAPLHDIPVYSKRLGIKNTIQPFYSIALGTSEVTPLELTTAYSTIANKGVFIEPIGILKVEDRNGLLLEDFRTYAHEALSQETAYLVTDLMQGVVDGGTAQGVRRFFHLPAAGKTGTTQDFADAWFVGFTPSLCAGVWVGFDDQRVKFTGWYGQGAKAAAPIWGRFMQKVYDDKRIGLIPEYFDQPENITTVTFCEKSLQQGIPKLANENCPVKITDVVNSKFNPEMCDIHTTGGFTPLNVDTTSIKIDW
ncbi:MAG: PBP1A family penicillin-binding protein [Ignavibacteria bacterium]|nr:PBP1A family penicillin-binding protein [Ignavibacteria bacterium]